MSVSHWQGICSDDVSLCLVLKGKLYGIFIMFVEVMHSDGVMSAGIGSTLTC